MPDIFEKKQLIIMKFMIYNTIFTIYNFYYKIKNLKLKNNNFIPNKYLSKSLIHMHALKYNNDYDLIYFYLYLIDKIKKYDSNIINILLDIGNEKLDIYIKTYNYYYI